MKVWYDEIEDKIWLGRGLYSQRPGEVKYDSLESLWWLRVVYIGEFD